MTEIYEIPQGKIIIGSCNQSLSWGLLQLNPKQALSKHNRPVTEELVQIQGKCVMKLFDQDKLVEEVTLKEGKKLVILANQFHIHTNPFDSTSITLWRFEGNVADIIENIRKNSKKIL